MSKKRNSNRPYFLLKFIPQQWIDSLKSERRFLLLMGFFFVLAAFTYPNPGIAMWVGFFFAAYSAIANDSIQTIGTFLASNQDRKWWILWLYIGGIFLCTVTYSWYMYDGDVTYQRLSSRGFDSAPEQFAYLQVAAPLFLLILTRLRMPVSTTFLLLSAFATDSGGIALMLQKSISGYFVAFTAAIIIWLVLSGFIEKIIRGEAHKLWRPAQWIISGFLWAVWLMQDAANIAVYLPRSLGVNSLILFSGFIFLGLGILFYLKGDKIQSIVTEKSDVTDVRAATLIDGVYALILWYFKTISVIPMSTTWVFIGLLAGREIAISIRNTKAGKRSLKHSFKLIFKDLSYAIIGLIISIVLAVSINPIIWDELMVFIFG